MTSGSNSWHWHEPDYRNPPKVSPSSHTEAAIRYASNCLWLRRTFPMHVIPATVPDINLIGLPLPPKGTNLPIWPWREFICRHHAELIDCVRDGWHHGAELLCDFADALTTEEKPLPLWLQEYLVGVAREEGSIRRKRGRDMYANVDRDNDIAMVVSNTVEVFDLRPTRNAATTTECGCSIVAKALRGIGVEMSEANIAAIWRAAFRPRKRQTRPRKRARRLWGLSSGAQNDAQEGGGRDHSHAY